MKTLSYAVLAVVFHLSVAAAQSPYAGEELRPIKSMSSQQIESLKAGKGMGFAKLAELNHYPGPRHVLELADDLGLTAEQLTGTQELFNDMHQRAVDVGESLIKAEMALDREFASGEISVEALQEALLGIGKIQAELRLVHLEAHLHQKRLLTPEQVARYDELRGYLGGDDHDSGRDNTHH